MIIALWHLPQDAEQSKLRGTEWRAYVRWCLLRSQFMERFDSRKCIWRGTDSMSGVAAL